jgi:activating signal cointegrator complex subunit 2
VCSLTRTRKLQIGQTIPDHLRASIMRLVESQAEEEAAQARAIREAQGLPPIVEDDDDGFGDVRGRVRIGGDGEESGGEEDGDKVVVSRPCAKLNDG